VRSIFEPNVPAANGSSTMKNRKTRLQSAVGQSNDVSSRVTSRCTAHQSEASAKLIMSEAVCGMSWMISTQNAVPSNPSGGRSSSARSVRATANTPSENVIIRSSMRRSALGSSAIARPQI
jgi:hypothetical protein